MHAEAVPSVKSRRCEQFAPVSLHVAVVSSEMIQKNILPVVFHNNFPGVIDVSLLYLISLIN